ncbi:hypothetical protein B0H21DRAFT_735373 [Amylocystis lapponica]|nr:hypothetical protein B0H21DRAFT_735373 [Amylocystis lapponica]
MAAPTPSRATPERRMHHNTLYFPDGDIVLSALVDPVQEEGILIHPRQMFRVHRFILRRNSLFFSDMLSLPAPEALDANEMYDGVPLVPMQDSATDLASLLNALPFKHKDPNTPFLIRGILRLAVKYDMNPLRARILEHWAADWPRTLADWDHFESDIALMKARYDNARDGKLDGLFFDDHFPEPALAIRVAQDFGCTDILPAAYYRVACVSVKHDWTRARAAEAPLTVTSPLVRGEFTARWELLDHADLVRVLAAREFLSSTFFHLADALKTDPECDNVACENVQAHLREAVVPRYQARSDVLGAINACLKLAYKAEEFGSGYIMCQACKGEQDDQLNYWKGIIWRDFQTSSDICLFLRITSIARHIRV